jgi:hypothetical protein
MSKTAEPIDDGFSIEGSQEGTAMNNKQVTIYTQPG